MSNETQVCPACHTPLPAEAHFCLNCGTPTPTEPGVPARTQPTGAVEVSRVRLALSERYRIDRVLGEGGMATVYLAEDLKHKRTVAVKVMRPELAETLGSDRFLREIEIAAQLNHPNILPVFDSGSTKGILWYVMPYIEGESLPARLHRETQLPVAEALRIAREVAEALAYANGRGIIHRDIKPANILLSHGHALVADFGIARAMGNDAGSITKTGLAVGTPQYMSPEQATGARDVDGRADVYALGAVLYEMVSGEPPFTGPTMQAVIARSLTESPRPLSATRQGLPPRLTTLVTRALAKSPSDRFQTTSDMATALGEIEGQLRGTGGEMTSLQAPSPGRIWLAFGVTALVVLIGLVLMAVRRGVPTWVMVLAGALIVGGAVALALTAAAEKRRATGAPGHRFDAWLTWRNAALGGVAALALWAMTATSIAVGSGGGSVAGTRRVAVLPFQNQGAAEDQYLADGISDEVRGKLTSIGSLSVIASTSTDQYRNTAKTPEVIAGELGADYLLLGKVRWATGDDGQRRVQVTPELINGKTGVVTWQQPFDANVADVFSVQTMIATRVADALGAVLGVHEKQDLATRPTSNTAAYDLYLKGRAIRSPSAGDKRRAAGFFEQAVALDSTFQEAWAALSGAMSSVYANGNRDPASGRRAREAAEIAVRLDSTKAAGHRAMASYYRNVTPDLNRAYDETQLALRASPNDPDILASSAGLLRQLGRLQEALTVAERARDLDPRSVSTLSSLQTLLTLLHRGPEAQRIGQQLAVLDPANPSTVQSNVISYLLDGKVDEAKAVFRNALDTIPEPDLVAYMAGYSEMGWLLTDQQRQLLFRLTPAAFDNDRAWWGQSLAITAWDQGDHARGRGYADSGLAVATTQLEANPADLQLRVLRGVMLAYLGRKSEAVAEADKVLAAIKPGDTIHYYEMNQTVRIFLAVGETDRALDGIETLLKAQYTLTPAWLRVDPLYAPLRGNPRFERLIADRPTR